MAAQIKQGQEALLDACTALMNYAMKFGHSYLCWQQVVNVMLQKDPGNPRIHRLLVIHLYEAQQLLGLKEGVQAFCQQYVGKPHVVVMASLVEHHGIW